MERGRERLVTEAFPTTAILAGGPGTRLGPLTAGLPKPLIEVAGRPFLLHQLDQLAGFGATRVVLLVGYRAEQIEAVIGTEQFGISIAYSYDRPGLDGTLGALRRALPLLGERFLVLYGDTYLPIDFAAVASAWSASGLPAVMTVLHNRGVGGPSNVEFDGRLVNRYDKANPTPEMEWIDYGLTGASLDAFGFAEPDATDLVGLFGPLAARSLLLGVEVEEPFHEIGSPEALAATAAFLSARAR